MSLIRFAHILSSVAAILASGLILHGCGSGSSGQSALTVNNSTLANNVSGVASNLGTMEFSVAVDPTTAIAANITLTRANSDPLLPLNITVAGSRLTITPLRPLLPLTNYTLRIGSGLRGVSGEQFIAQSTTFTTGDGSWKNVQLN